MKALIFVLVFLMGWTGFSEISLPSNSKSLFSIENLPGSGTLNFKWGEQEENLEFGKDKSFYSIGLVFERKNLPLSVSKSIPKHLIIQLALSNRNSVTPDRLTQFGAVTLKVLKVPKTEPLNLKCQEVSKAEKTQNESAFILFNSSQTKISAEDQDKLKNTVFSENGQVKITPVGSAETILVKHEGKRLPFKRQMMSLGIDTSLATPFNSERGTLKGTLEVPLFWPANSEANRLVAEIAKESLEKDSDINPPEKAPRTLASPEEAKPSNK